VRFTLLVFGVVLLASVGLIGCGTSDSTNDTTASTVDASPMSAVPSPRIPELKRDTEVEGRRNLYPVHWRVSHGSEGEN
jgi:hypothetical protein